MGMIYRPVLKFSWQLYRLRVYDIPYHRSNTQDIIFQLHAIYFHRVIVMVKTTHERRRRRPKVKCKLYGIVLASNLDTSLWTTTSVIEIQKDGRCSDPSLG